MYYRLLRKGSVSTVNAVFISAEEDYNKYIDDNTKEHYISVFNYTQAHVEQYNLTKSIAGIQDTVGNMLIWDLDNGDLEEAASDALGLVQTLRDVLKISVEQIQIYFSGGKGFHVAINTENTFSVSQFKDITRHFAEFYKSWDSSVSDPNRCIRVENTKHKSGMYKIALSYQELDNLSIEEIKNKALKPGGSSLYTDKINISKLLQENKKVEEVKKEAIDLEDISLYDKPRWLTNCRWMLQNGFFDVGRRNESLLCLAATYKNQGFTKEHVSGMLDVVAELSFNRYNSEKLSQKEVNNILGQVFSHTWNGGQYSCKTPNNFLYDYCRSLGDKSCKHQDNQLLHIHDLSSGFEDYIDNLDKNIIRTGLSVLDKSVPLTIGMPVLLLGAAGSGKTSLALEILNNTSKSNILSVCASLDMSNNRFYEKILYRITGQNRSSLYGGYKNNKDSLQEAVKQEFGNVVFYKQSCPTVSNIKYFIKECEQQKGEKIRLVLIDYFERIISDLSDDTAASKKIAGELQDMMDELNICLVTLVQPNKMAISGGPDKPLRDYSKIKGSSFLYQSARAIISLWRPFYTPNTREHDKYLQMAILKNDFGELDEFTFGWHGPTGKVQELTDDQLHEFRRLLDEKEEREREAQERTNRALQGW